MKDWRYGKTKQLYNRYTFLLEGNLLNDNAFIRALLAEDIKAMNVYMNRVALETFSYFDTGRGSSLEEPERFWAV